MGILGLGHIGRALAAKASCLGIRVLALTRAPGRDTEGVDGFFQSDGMAQWASHCDFVVIAIPVTSQTLGMINESLLGAMKPEAFLIDCSDISALIDYQALERAVMEDRIAGVCL